MQDSLDELLTSLPACRRCRSNKRRCDPSIPACRNCSKAAVECVFYDHVTKQDVSRSYVASLVHRLQQPSPRPLDGNTSQRAAASSENPFSKPHRYLGPRACITYNSFSSGLTSSTPVIPPRLEAPAIGAEHEVAITPELGRCLLDFYVKHIHCIHPFLDVNAPPFTPTPYSRIPTRWEQLMTELIYATACHCVDQDGYRGLADQCHQRAMGYIDHATRDVTIEALQAITLLSLHSFFNPQQGNTSQLVGFAARVAMDIERQGSQEQQNIVQRIYSTIYCMENKLITALDRPGLLPEPTGPLNFEITSPDTLICSLYRLQSRFRNSDQDASTLLQYHVRINDSSWLYLHSSLNPNALAVVYETYLLISPSPTVACRLLSCYNRVGYIPTFLTPHWAYKAGVMLFAELPRLTTLEQTQLMQAFSDCNLTLDRCSRCWSNSTLLKQAIESLLNKDDRAPGTASQAQINVT